VKLASRFVTSVITRLRATARRGMTLIELMITIGIIVMLIGIGTIGIASIQSADVGATTSILSGAMRYVYTLAIHNNKTYRLVIDMDNRLFYTEMADDEGDPCARYIPEDANAGLGNAEEEEARDEDGDEDEEGARTRVSFSEDDGALLSEEFRPHTNVTAVMTEHQSEPQTTGRAAIYFYPTGRAERAMVWVGEGEEENGELVWFPTVTLELFALGRVQRYGRVVDEGEFMRDLK